MDELTSSIPTTTTTKRSSRATENRSYDGRVTEERPPIVYSNGTRFNLPTDLINGDPDHKYSFIVYSSGNQEQKENYFEAIDRGYQPVRASEHPTLARRYNLSPFDRKEEDDLIKRGGQILMKRPSDVHKAEEDYYNERTHRQNYMADMYKQHDPRLPRPFMDERKRVRM